MSIKLGSLEISKVFLGNNEINVAYLNSNEIFRNKPEDVEINWFQLDTNIETLGEEE